eukprot:EG_transcript_13446
MGATESLQTLIEENRLPELQALLAQPGCDVNAGFQNPPLYLAIACNNVEAVRFLLTLPQLDVNKDGGPPLFRQGPLYLAVHNGNHRIAELLLAHPDVDVNKGYYGTPLLRCIEKGDLRMLKLLLEQPRLDVNYAFGTTPLAKCLAYRNVEALKLLLGHPRVRVAAVSGDLLLFALTTYALDLLALLVQHRETDPNVVVADPANPHLPPGTPLYRAILQYVSVLKYGDTREAREGKFWEPDLGDAPCCPDNPLQRSNRYELYDEVARLASVPNAVPGAVDDGKAVQCRAMIELLLSCPNCDPNRGSEPVTPLHLCAHHGLADITALLLQYHPEVDLTLRDGLWCPQPNPPI